MIFKNNPLNIRFDGKSKWFGMIEPKRGFCQFVSVYYGLRAALYLMFKTYPNKYKVCSVEDVITRWAPPSDDNDTSQYIEFVCHKCGFLPTFNIVNLSLADKFKLVNAMCKIESGYDLSYSVFCKSYKMLFPYEKV